MKRKFFGIICILFSGYFAHEETQYFGNNFFPNTNAELMCDIVSLLLCFSGAMIFWSDFKDKRSNVL